MWDLIVARVLERSIQTAKAGAIVTATWRGRSGVPSVVRLRERYSFAAFEME
jgi:hypothetical protein